MSFGFLFCLICGLAIWGVAFAVNRAASRLRREGLRAQGTVIDNVEVRGDSGREWVPVIGFTDNLGYPVEFSPSVRTGRKWPPGRTVKVVYLPDRPHAARVESWSELRLGALGLFVFGAMFIGAAIAIATGH
ncbi:DUF3592 domain-containing protein [Streptosporangium sp. NPDC051023]|uniref:DUF3592 domain-containing protein n=1 Tax=Streptosporangium sp. NPDC051023 TaxID=3155410 RepID=UPI00344C9A14